VTVTLRITVTPAEQLNFVTEEANSARFKYLMGKKSGVKPVLAQKLSAKAAPNSGLLEARVGAETREVAQRYVDAFVETLRSQCGGRVRLELAEQSIK
jgi:hypothetical protein